MTFWGAKVSAEGHIDFLEREQTGAIKGIFAVIILYGHARDYLQPADYAGLYDRVPSWLGQLMVVMFLLYSGYGIMEALKRDRQKYMSTFLRHRLLRTWLMFAAAVVLFMIMNLLLGHNYSVYDNLMALTGWSDVGNSSWFVCVILILYLLTYGALFVVKKTENVVWLTFVLAIGLIIVLINADKGACWYDTILAYPTGMLVSIYKPWISERLHGRNWYWAIGVTGALLLLTYIASANGNRPGFWPLTLHLISAMFFGVFVVLLTMRLKLQNRALSWLGTNAFAIYILQRLAMITCAHFGLNGSPVLFVGVVLPATLLIASLFTAAFNRVRL
ncbi:MAG: acyltransferase [Bacteroides sp.]|nr:acyltransferase [Bacteroides sp.]MCM1378968.1 acyltransferase [Bacteroides sp.]MCM1445584.1 acyltransferase [Prevotella sp.]